MNSHLITSRVADLVRNPSSPMPSDWERGVHSKESDATNAKPKVNPVKPAKIDPPEFQTQNGEQTQTLSSGDTLTLSPLARKILEESDSSSGSDWEKNRNERVQRVQQLVQDKQYSMTPEIVDGIAHRIVEMLP
ncbi:hypothetical protein AGMMS49938_14550 [Fibrobacterales bacterium]|nr:hypothetical protein AGMMS49938_14550 [Fibrobacterales bacterium]